MKRTAKVRGAHAARRRGVSTPAILGAACMAAYLTVGTQALALEGQPADAGDAASEPVEQPAAASSSYARGAAVPAQSKSETVRIKAGADGAPEAATVESELTGNGAGMLLDRSDMRGITDVEGARDYSVDGQEIVWAADGDTVSYAGTTAKEAPVSVSIAYELDGNPIAPGKLAGKSGHVRMSVSYENASRTATADVGGQDVEVRTPFLCATLFTIDPGKFTNVEVEGGKVVEVAGSKVVAGFGLPGFADTLGVDLGELAGDAGLGVDLGVGLGSSLGQGFAVEADVTDFSLAQTMTIATCQPFAEIDADSLDTSSLDDMLSTLQSSMDALASGDGTLAGGLDKLLSGARALESGTAALSEGASSLAQGAQKLDDSVSTLPDATGKLAEGSAALANGASSLSDGLSTLDEKASALPSGASKLLEGARSLEAGAEALDEGASSLAAAFGTSDDTAASQTLIGLANSACAAADQLQQEAAELKERYPTIAASKQATVERLESELSQLRSYADALVTALQSASKGADALSSGTSSLHAGTTSLAEGVKTLDSSANALVEGVDTLAEGAENAASGTQSVSEGNAALAESSDTLAEGVSSLASGAASLEEGAGKLASGAPALTQGLKGAHDGSAKLASGLSQFSEQAIGRIVDLLGGNVDSASARLKAMVGLASQYDTFTGKTDGTEGSVTFVIQTAEIGQ